MPKGTHLDFHDYMKTSTAVDMIDSYESFLANFAFFFNIN